MRKLKLLMAVATIMFCGGTANAQVMIETDLTSLFNSLATTQWTGSSGQVGWAAPKVTTNSGLEVAAWESYCGDWNGGCTNTGTIMKTTVSGLTAGTYKIELYGAAAFTFNRGFGSDAFTGDPSVGGKATSDTYTAGQSIDSETGVYLYATTSIGTYQNEIPIWYADNFNGSGLSTVSLQGVEVGDDGNIEIGMSKTSQSTNWHVVQLKGVTATVDAVATFAVYKAEAEELYDSPMKASVLSDLQNAANVDLSSAGADEYKTAIEALAALIVTANASVANYAVAKEILDAANGYDAAGQAAYAADETIAAIQAAYSEGTLESVTNDQKTAATTALANACKAQTQPADGCNMTPWIVNPDFAAGNSNGWTKDTPLGGNCQIQGGTRMEYWAGNASNRAEASFNIYQVINDIPDGVYQVTAYMYNSLNGEGGDYTEFSPTCGVYGVGINEEVGLVTTEGDVLNPYTTGNIFVYGGKLTVGVKNTVTPMAARWFLVDKFELTYVRELTSDDIDNLIGPAKTAWETALAKASEAYEAHEAAQLGSEGVALYEEIEKTEPSDIEGYTAATEALTEATEAFNTAAPSYDMYAAYRAETVAAFGEELAATVEAPTTAEEAATALQSLNIAQYDKVASDYTFSCSGLIGDFGSWTGTATVAGEAATPNYLDYEHWSGVTHAYYEQASNGWGNAKGWTIQYEKTCTLPAGDYVIKVAARSSENTTSLVSCTATDNTITLPNVGAYAKGINKAGEASWTEGQFARDGVGFGWQWRFLPFTLDSETEVTMTFYAEAKSLHQWMSIADGELLSKTKLAEDIAYDETTSNTIEDKLIADVTIARTIKEGYNTVVLPFDATANQVAEAFGTGTEVYAFSEDSENAAEATVNFTKGDGSITANVPVLIKATAESNSQEFEGVQIKAAEAKVTGTNFDFVGTYAPISALAEGNYFVGNGAVYKSAGATSLNAFRAYIAPKAAEARIVKFFIDGVEIETTGIEGIKTAAANNGKIYNLAGQQVKKAQKGLYIQNGKKFVVK